MFQKTPCPRRVNPEIITIRRAVLLYNDILTFHCQHIAQIDPQNFSCRRRCRGEAEMVRLRVSLGDIGDAVKAAI